MESIVASNTDVRREGPIQAEGNDVKVEGFSKSIDDISQKVTQVRLIARMKIVSDFEFESQNLI